MHKPKTAMKTILIATANDARGTLELANEANEIQNILLKRIVGNYQVQVIPEATTQRLVEALNLPNTEIEILHFSGHANGASLYFTDTAADAAVLSERLRGYASLKLVFLNGCATKKQVEFFHNVGIPFVIATSRPVEDAAASNIATCIYDYLTLGKSLRETMRLVTLDARLIKSNINMRAIGNIAEVVADSAIPWALYPKDSNSDYNIQTSIPIITIENSVNHDTFLRSLILSLKDYCSPINSDYENTIQTIEDGGYASSETISQDLLKVLPLPLGIRLRQIISNPPTKQQDPEQYYTELRYDYAFYFETLFHYTASILLSQIWNNKSMISSTTTERFDLVRTYLKENQLNENLADYADLIRTALEIIQISGIENIAPKIVNVLTYIESEAFKKACAFFDKSKKYYWQSVRLPISESVENCFAAQDHLKEAFPYFGYFIENVLASVSSIKVVNFRHVEKAYHSDVSKLIVNSDFRNNKWSDPMENKGILMFNADKFNASTPSLNLVPFYIDRNVFIENKVTIDNRDFDKQSKKVVDMYMFIGYFSDKFTNDIALKKVSYPCYYYVSLNDPKKIWRFDPELLGKNADYTIELVHINEEVSETFRRNNLLTYAGELKDYLEQFKGFFINQK